MSVVVYRRLFGRSSKTVRSPMLPGSRKEVEG